MHPSRTPAEALASGWDLHLALRPAPDAGLVNRTWLVGGEPAAAVLQQVNRIFDPRLHHDVEAGTTRLAARGVVTPRLERTTAGELWLADAGGPYRLLSYVPGRTYHRLASPRQAAAAGRLVGRFHAALAGWDHAFAAPPRCVHDTPARMAELVAALESAAGHPLAGPTQAVGLRILRAWESWDGELDLPLRLCHGDLKISNLRFAAEGDDAVCLLDLDTLEPMPLASEMGDAWRSWCNPAGEDDPAAAAFDRELFSESARAWLAAAPPLTPAERHSLVPGIERICLELAARFAADAVRNSYFREDRDRHPEPGSHNLRRARSQLALAASCRAQRAECEAIVRQAGDF